MAELVWEREKNNNNNVTPHQKAARWCATYMVMLYLFKCKMCEQSFLDNFFWRRNWSAQEAGDVCNQTNEDCNMRFQKKLTQQSYVSCGIKEKEKRLSCVCSWLYGYIASGLNVHLSTHSNKQLEKYLLVKKRKGNYFTTFFSLSSVFF